MGEQRGFWSTRPRKGQEDARLIAVAHIHALRQRSFEELRRDAGSTHSEDVRGLSGERFRRRTSITRWTRGGEEELRIRVQVSKPSRLGRLNPLVEEEVIATADGQTVGEYTMAGEDNDPRRYRFPGQR